MLLAVDPGAGKTASIGVALFRMEDGALQGLHKFTRIEFEDFLDKQKDITHVVFEIYQIREEHAKAHIGSRVEVVETIGVLKSWARKKNLPVAQQYSRILGPAKLMFGVKIEKGQHVPDEISAFLHGMYWLHRQGLVQTVLEQEMKVKKNAAKNDSA